MEDWSLVGLVAASCSPRGMGFGHLWLGCAHCGSIILEVVTYNYRRRFVAEWTPEVTGECVHILRESVENKS